MAISEARHRANERYNAKAYDDIKVRVPKGQKDIIKDVAKQGGEGINAYIYRLIKEDLSRKDFAQHKSADNRQCNCSAKGTIRCDICNRNLEKYYKHENPSEPGLYLCETIAKDGACLYEYKVMRHNGISWEYEDIEVVRCREIREIDV